MTNGLTQRILVGAGAGALATVPMSAVMLLSQRLGLMGKQPPAKITDAALDSANLAPSRKERDALAIAAHVAFGAATGVLFALLRPGRARPARGALEGAAYGTAIWAASYAGWIPAVGIMPPPSKDRPGRPASMVLAHWVFGATLALAIARSRR